MTEAAPNSGAGWRIVHTEHSLGWGGQEHRVLAELCGFQQRGSRVWLLAPPSACLFARAQEAQVAARPLETSKLRFAFSVVQLARWLKTRRIQVLNPHSSRDGWLAGLAGRLARVPLIVRSRHIDVDYPHRWLSRHAYTTLCDHVITTSDKITAHFQAMFGLPKERISTIPTGIDTRRFCPAGPKADWGVDAVRGPKIGMISVLRSWKGHATLLQAARRLKDQNFPARFIIVGEGPARAFILQQIGELDLSGVVTLAGHREDVPEILRSLDLLVIPSTAHEGIPQIGLQALATGTPVIGSDAGGIPEIVRPNETGSLFPAGDAAALAAAIRETLSNREKTAALCRRGRALVESQHSRDHMLDGLDALYRRYLSP